jgi:hypothetical protein
VKRTLEISAATFVLGLIMAGCSSSEKIHLTESGAPDFKSLEIVYDVNSVGGVAGLNGIPDVQLASQTDSNAAEPTQTARVRLEVQYPYPGVNPEFVHTTLRVLPRNGNLGLHGGAPTGLRGFSNANSRGGGLLSLTVGPPNAQQSDSGQECLVLDMPKTELGALFVDLAGDGFFKNPAVKDGESHLEVTYNEGQVEKAWIREPRLEQLVELLKKHGTPTVERPQNGSHPGYNTGRYGSSSPAN